MRFIDLFCGGGLGARGAVMAGFEPLVAVDNWDVAVSTYQDNFPHTDVQQADLMRVYPEQILRGRRAELLISSPECTNHSPAKGKGTRCEISKGTALITLRWAEVLKPKWILLENVIQFMRWPRYHELITGLKGLGYGVRELVLNSASLGVPQSRRRCYVLCEMGHEVPFLDFEDFEPQAAETILDPPNSWKTSRLYAPNRAKNTLARAERAIAELGKETSFLIVYYGSDGSGGWQSLKVPLRTITTLDRFALVTKLSGNYRMRMLQVPELSRAMGLPDEHRFNYGTRRDRIKLIGNGICAPVVEKILVKMLEGCNISTGKTAA